MEEISPTRSAPSTSGEKEEEDSCERCEQFLQQLKDKHELGTKEEKFQVLTLAPPKWSRKKVADEFNTSEYYVRAARKAFEERGILAKPQNWKKGGKCTG